MAIALSAAHRLTVEQFKRAIYETFLTSHSDWSLGIMNGELMEVITFAALQQANGGDIENPNRVPDFIKSLLEYLSPTFGNMTNSRINNIHYDDLSCRVHYEVKPDKNLIDSFRIGVLDGGSPKSDFEKKYQGSIPLIWKEHESMEDINFWMKEFLGDKGR